MDEFLANLQAILMAQLALLAKDTRGDIIEWSIGLLFLAILAINLAFPTMADAIAGVLASNNVSGVTAVVLRFIPTFVALAILLAVVGRRRL